MKRLLSILILMIAFVTVSTAQTKVTNNVVKSFTYSDSLEKDVVLTHNYAIANFAKTVRIQFDEDTLATGYIKIIAMLYGSLDYQNWTLLGDTLNIASATASATKDSLYKDVYYNYIRVYQKAIDSTQFVSHKYKLLFEIND